MANDGKVGGKPGAASVFDIPVTYSGLLDDVVDRHHITPEVNATFFNRAILRNVFFSGRILLNDGYLVNNPSALSQLVDENSLLRTMIKNGFVRLLVRQRDADAFARNPELMAANKIESFDRLVRRKDWPDIRALLYQFASGLYAYRMVDDWPPYRMDDGFRTLFARIFDKSLEDLGLDGLGHIDLLDLAERLDRHPAYATSPRGTVEEVLGQMRRAGLVEPRAVTGIMNIANQCYHYNFAMCLSAARNDAVVADTTIGRAFEDVLQFDQSVEADLANFPVLSVPSTFPMERGDIFDRLVDPTSRLSAAKHAFLANVEQVFRPSSNVSTEQRMRDVARAAEEYRRFLSEHFADHLSVSDWAPRVGSMITFGFGQIGSAIGADAIMLAANLGGAGNRVSSFIHRLTRPVTRRGLDVALDPNAGTADQVTFRVGEIRPRFASLAFDSAAASRHVSSMQRWEA